MSAKVMQMPPVHQGYSTARYVLRNHPYHDLDAIDAAFEVLAHSTDEADKQLCKVVADELFMVPRPGAMVIAITMVAVSVSCIGLVMLFARLVQ